MPGLDIGQPSDDPKWEAGELWSTVTIPLRGDQTIVSNGIQTLSVTPKPSTTYTLSDGSTSVVATTSDTTNLASLVNALKNSSDYTSLNFTVTASSTNDYLRVTYKDGNYQANSSIASLTPEGDETIFAENYPYPDEDSRSEREVEPFNITLETDETIKPSDDVVEIKLTNDDVQPVLSIVNLKVDGQIVTVEADLAVPNDSRPLLSSEIGSARVRLLRHDQLLDIYLGDLEFERSGPLATSSSAEATFTLPSGLMPSSDLRIELEMSRVCLIQVTHLPGKDSPVKAVHGNSAEITSTQLMLSRIPNLPSIHSPIRSSDDRGTDAKWRGYIWQEWRTSTVIYCAV